MDLVPLEMLPDPIGPGQEVKNIGRLGKLEEECGFLPINTPTFQNSLPKFR